MDEILSSLVRIGNVSVVDDAGRKVRVTFKDQGITSGWLYVIQHPGADVSVETNGDHTHTITGGGSASTDGDHDHSASVNHWMPKKKDTVLVLYLPVFNGDGFVLGAI